jgi:hypothetical protein
MKKELKLLSTISKQAVWIRNPIGTKDALKFWTHEGVFSRSITEEEFSNFSKATIVFREQKYLIDESGVHVTHTNWTEEGNIIAPNPATDPFAVKDGTDKDIVAVAVNAVYDVYRHSKHENKAKVQEDICHLIRLLAGEEDESGEEIEDQTYVHIG